MRLLNDYVKDISNYLNNLVMLVLNFLIYLTNPLFLGKIPFCNDITTECIRRCVCLLDVWLRAGSHLAG